MVRRKRWALPQKCLLLADSGLKNKGDTVSTTEKKTTEKRQYISLCPSIDEVKYIRMMYENHRSKMISEGNKPPSLSRHLINIIMSDIGDADGGISHG